MEKFSFLDTVDFAATVCDKEGAVLYQNSRDKHISDCPSRKAKDPASDPLVDESGAVAGLIELAIDLPDNMPVFDRDNTEAQGKAVCEHNPSINGPCPKECPRHGKCCLCVAHHREHGKLPVCMREKQ